MRMREREIEGGGEETQKEREREGERERERERESNNEGCLNAGSDRTRSGGVIVYHRLQRQREFWHNSLT